MKLYSIVVEGAHDASFLAHLLKKRGFSRLHMLLEVPEPWVAMIPRKFPFDGDKLDRVMRFPEIFVQDEISVGIFTSGSDSQLIKTLRDVLDGVGIDEFAGVAIFIDIDDHEPATRFNKLCKRIQAMNAAAATEKQPGYPIVIPTSVGMMEAGAPAVGVYMFPDNSSQGCLEDMLIQCANANHLHLTRPSGTLIKYVDTKCARDLKELKDFRSGSGRKKALVGTIANLLRPGVSVAVSLAQTEWLSDDALKLDSVKKVDEFLENLLSS